MFSCYFHVVLPPPPPPPPVMADEDPQSLSLSLPLQLLLFKLIRLLFPTSDFRHPVVTPAMIFMGQLLIKVHSLLLLIITFTLIHYFHSAVPEMWVI